MLNPFVCGTFHPEDDELCFASTGSSPRKYKRKNNNPYSTRGLDKFSALLDDLNEKRQKIYSQMNPHDISFVRFVHSNTDDFVPIIVKVKNKDQKHKSQELKVVKPRNLTPNNSESTPTDQQPTATMEEGKQIKLESDKKATKKRLSWNINNMEKPFFYLPLVVILVLVLLTLFGRSAATIFTCVLWYVIPTLKEYNSSSNTGRLVVKKRDYVRGLSEKKMVVVTSNEGVKKKDYVRGFSEKKTAVVTSNEGVKKKDYVRGFSEKKTAVVTSNEGVKKKDYVRGFSEKKMAVVTSNEGVKKKDYVRGWSEKMVATDGLFSPKSGDSETSKNKIRAKHSHKKSW